MLTAALKYRSLQRITKCNNIILTEYLYMTVISQPYISLSDTYGGHTINVNMPIQGTVADSMDRAFKILQQRTDESYGKD